MCFWNILKLCSANLNLHEFYNKQVVWIIKPLSYWFQIAADEIFSVLSDFS